MTLSFFRDYQELFVGCQILYDGSYSGTTLYNVINSGTYDGVIAGSPNRSADQFELNTTAFDWITSGDSAKRIDTQWNPTAAGTWMLLYKKADVVNSGNGYMGAWDGAASTSYLLMGLPDNSKKAQFGTGDLTNGSKWMDSLYDLNNGNWRVLTLSWGTNGTRLYIDGVLNASNTTTPITSALQTIWIGAEHYCAGTNRSVLHTTGPCAIFNVQKSDTDILTLSRLMLKKLSYPIYPGVRSCL